MTVWSQNCGTLRINADCLAIVLEMVGGFRAFSQVNTGAREFWHADKFSRIRDTIFRDLLFQKLDVDEKIAPLYIVRNTTYARISARQIDAAYLVKEYNKLKDHKSRQASPDSILPVIQNLEHKKDWISSYFLAHILSISRFGRQMYGKNATDSCSYIIHSSLSYSSWLVLLQDSEMAESILTWFKDSKYSLHLDSEGRKLCASSILRVYDRTQDLHTKQECHEIFLQLMENDEPFLKEIQEIIDQLHLAKRSRTSEPVTEMKNGESPLAVSTLPEEQALRALHTKRRLPKIRCCAIS